MDQNLPPKIDQEKYEKPKKVKNFGDVVEIFTRFFITVSTIFLLFIIFTGLIHDKNGIHFFEVFIVIFVFVLLILSVYSIAKTFHYFKPNIIYEYLDFKIVSVFKTTFFIFYFGFLIYYDYIGIKIWNSGGEDLVKVSVIFWIAGIIMAYIKYKKRL